MAPLADLDGWKKKNRNAAASKGGASKGRKRSTALGDLTVKQRASKWHKSKKEAQKNKSSSNSQEESNEACSDFPPPMALLVDEGGASKGSPALGELVSKKHKEEQKSVAQEESKKVIRDDSEEPNEASPPDPTDYYNYAGRSRFWEQCGAYLDDDSDDLTDDSDDLTDDSPPDPNNYWGHNHEECIKSFRLVSDISPASYSSPPREANVLPYNLDDMYELDPRWFDRPMELCLKEIRGTRPKRVISPQQTPLRPALESGRGD